LHNISDIKSTKKEKKQKEKARGRINIQEIYSLRLFFLDVRLNIITGTFCMMHTA